MSSKQKRSKLNRQTTSTENKKKPTLGKRICLNIAAFILAIVMVLAGSMLLFELKRHNSGFENRDQLIIEYFNGMTDINEHTLRKCFYPVLENVSDDIEKQIAYATSESEHTTWKPSEMQIKWNSFDTEDMQRILSNIEIEEAAKCIVFLPLEQKLENGITVLEEDIYQFYVHKTKGKWYIAAFMQTSRNITGAVKPDGTTMTEKETSEWLMSLAVEIGSDTVGYLYVDNYWSEITDGNDSDDAQIKTYITNDYSSYMTMAVIKDSDIDSFQEYSTSIITESPQNYGNIIESDGVIGEFPVKVQIAQNEESGARIIVWVFKTSDNDDFTHVITLESVSDYDASTYINTFHLVREKTSDASDMDQME